MCVWRRRRGSSSACSPGGRHSAEVKVEGLVEGLGLSRACRGWVVTWPAPGEGKSHARRHRAPKSGTWVIIWFNSNNGSNAIEYKGMSHHRRWVSLVVLNTSPALSLSSSASSLRWNTRAVSSGLSIAVCPGSKSDTISGHFGLHVKVRNNSGFPSFRVRQSPLKV